MTVMPAPPLVMLPPPTSPTLERLGLPAFPSASTSASPQRSSSDAAFPIDRQQSEPGATGHLSAPEAKSFERYAFDVIQTPGGTVQAGFWVPRSQSMQSDRHPPQAKSKAEVKAAAARTPDRPALITNGHSGSAAAPMRASSAAPTGEEYFQPW